MRKFNHLIILLLIGGLLLPFLGYADEILSRPSHDDFVIDLVWGTETYVPADFRGKDLPIRGSIITVVALTPAQNVSNLEFSWFIKDLSSSMPGADDRGVGKDTFTFKAENIIPNFVHEIEVIAKNIYTGKSGLARVEIPLTHPEIRLYRDGQTPVSGKITTAPDSTLSIIVKPFYFNTLSLADLSFSWMFDGQRIFGDEEDELILNITPDTLPGTEKTTKIAVQNQINNKERAQLTTSLFITPRR